MALGDKGHNTVMIESEAGGPAQRAEGAQHHHATAKVKVKEREADTDRSRFILFSGSESNQPVSLS